MSRQCSKDVLNYLTLGTNVVGTALAGATQISVHAWAKFTSFDPNDGSQGDRVLNLFAGGIDSSLVIGIDSSNGSSNRKLNIQARSIAADALQSKISTTSIPTGSWLSLGGMVDIAGSRIDPYLNGVAEGGGAVTFLSGTYVQGVSTQDDQIGASNIIFEDPTTTGVDGLIAEVAIWNVGLTALEFAALSKGYSPELIRPGARVRYYRLMGRTSPEPDTAKGTTATIVGTVPQASHPGIIYAAAPQFWTFGASGGTPPPPPSGGTDRMFLTF